MRYVGALDQGTTSTRFIIFDHGGAVVASAQREHRQVQPRPGWVEHDPAEIWEVSQAVIVEALADGGLAPRDLAALGIANQRETTLLWERATGRPVHNALVWQDRRTDPLVAEMAAHGGTDRFRDATGLPLASYFSALKLRWLLDTVPGARARAEAGELLFGTMDAWLLWNLAGLHVTDVTNASRTQLMNLRSLAWDETLVEAFGIPRAVLPAIVASSGVLGTARGLLAGVPVAGVLGDQQAALFGQACFNAGDAKNTYGTGCFLLANTGETPVVSRHGLITTLAYQRAGEAPRYALEGSIAVTGALVQWLRDKLGLIRSSAEVEALAASVPDNGGVYFVPAFSGLYAPHWRADARGIIAGLTGYAGAAHIARAALEATAFQVADVVRAMQEDTATPLRALRADGGMTRNGLLMQFQADLLDMPVVRPHVIETTTLGAAYAAGLAVGYWRGLEEVRAHWDAARIWMPSMDPARRATLTRSWRQALTHSYGWEPEAK